MESFYWLCKDNVCLHLNKFDWRQQRDPDSSGFTQLGAHLPWATHLDIRSFIYMLPSGHSTQLDLEVCGILEEFIDPSNGEWRLCTWRKHHCRRFRGGNHADHATEIVMRHWLSLTFFNLNQFIMQTFKRSFVGFAWLSAW